MIDEQAEYSTQDGKIRKHAVFVNGSIIDEFPAPAKAYWLATRLQRELANNRIEVKIKEHPGYRTVAIYQ